jgi:hypothetical protein
VVWSRGGRGRVQRGREDEGRWCRPREHRVRQRGIMGGPGGREGRGRTLGRGLGNDEVGERMGEVTMGARALGRRGD